MNLENFLTKGIKTGIILILLTPLVLASFCLTFSAYPKAVFFRSIVEIIFVFYLILVFKNRKYLPKISSLVISVFAFVSILIITSFSGINFYRSFFGDPERAVGVILFLHLLAFFVIIIGFLKNKKEWFNLLKISLVVSCISSFAGILQKLNVFSFYGTNSPERISGTLSNPDFFGSYMVLSIFLAFFVFLIEEKKNLRLVWLSILFFNIFTLILSGTRGAWVGLMLGMIFLLPFWFFYHSGFSVKKRKIILLGILFISIIFFCAALFPAKSGLKDNYFFNRFISIFEFSLGSRGEIWNLSFEAWKEKPILGWGPESFSYVFAKNFEARYLEVMPEWMYFDYSHNKVLNLMVESGLLGILGYFSIFFAVFHLSLKRNKSWEGFNQRSKNIFSLALAAFLIAYFAQNLFIFDTLSSYLIFFLILGFINNNFLSDKEEDDSIKSKTLSKTSKIFLVFIIVLFTAFFYHLNWKPTKAAMFFPEFVVYEKTDPQKALLGYKQALNKKTIYDKDFRLLFIERMLFILEKGSAKNAEEQIIKSFIEIKSDFEKDLEKRDRRPSDSLEYLARINERIYLFTKDEIFLKEMGIVLEKAILFNNQTLEFYRLKGELKVLQEDDVAAEIYFNKMRELNPDGLKGKADFYKNFGIAYLKAQKNVQAVEKFKKAFYVEYYSKKFTSKSVLENPISFAISVALFFCRDLNDLESCYDIYEKAIEIYPDDREDLQNYFDKSINQYGKNLPEPN